MELVEHGHTRWRAPARAGIVLLLLLANLPAALPDTLRVVILWALLLAAPGFVLGVDRWVGGSALRRVGATLAVSAAWSLPVLAILVATACGLRLGWWIWLASLIPLVMVAAARQRCSGPGTGRPIWPLLLAALPLLVHLALQPPGLRLDSDVPAHLAAVQDARILDRWAPGDLSHPGADGSVRDPRMGVLHGAHAALAGELRLSPLREWQGSAALFAVFYLLAFAWLFHELGLSTAWALAAALLQAMGNGGGAALGLWASVYPSQAALALLALALAWFLYSAREQRAARFWWVGSVVLGASVLVHPFAWWAGGLILLHLLVVRAIARDTRGTAEVARFGGLALLLGLVLLAPQIVRGSPTGSQWIPTGVLYLGRRWFTIDPFLLLRWSGALAFLAVLFALWNLRRTRGGMPSSLALSATLPLWTVALNPWLQPLVYAKVGYLSERLGLVTLAPAVLFLALRPREGDRDSRWATAFRAGILLLLLGAAWPKAVSSPYLTDGRSEARLREVVEALPAAPAAVLADPRSSYGIRALRGGPMPVLPVAHASPGDAGLEPRLAVYRRWLAERDPHATVTIPASLGTSVCFVPREIDSYYQGLPEYGFIPRSRRQQALVPRAVEGGAAVDTLAAGWILHLPQTPDPLHGRGSDGRDPTASASPTLTLEGLEFASESVRAGAELGVRVKYEGSLGNDWKQLRIQFATPAGEVPGLFRTVDKFYRKLWVERSLQSSHRFAVAWVPFDGDPGEGSSGEEFRVVQVPAWMEAGRYGVSAWLEPVSWRPNHHLRDYLRDEPVGTGARWTGEIEIEATRP